MIVWDDMKPIAVVDPELTGDATHAQLAAAAEEGLAADDIFMARVALVNAHMERFVRVRKWLHRDPNVVDRHHWLGSEESMREFHAALLALASNVRSSIERFER